MIQKHCLLEKWKKHFNNDSFDCIDSWVDTVDYWAISDHLSINLLGHFPLHDRGYQQRLFSWLDSPLYWRRRQALTAYLLPARNNPIVFPIVLKTIAVLLPEKNYYIQKAIPWILREGYRKHPQNHAQAYAFLQQHRASFSKTHWREAMRYLSAGSV